jgi:GAF domain-containing protein
MVQIPYMVEGGSFQTIDPFPIGEGLTSILIKTGEPLMLVEDTEAKAAQLGAKVMGKPAKSWLGVPLLVAGEVTGAMVVQDLAQEHRFDEADLQVLNTLASQVAVAIRNARLLESAHQQAERERLLLEITNKIRLASNMKTILSVTATELREALNARWAAMKIGVDVIEPQAQPPENRQPGEQVLQGNN